MIFTSFHDGVLLSLFFDPENGVDVLPKRRLTFNRLHDMFLNILLFIPTAVRTPYPKSKHYLNKLNTSPMFPKFSL
jgi:hypothetical protein